MARPPADVLDRYLAALTALDTGLTGNVERALRRGCNTCFDIASNKPAATVLDNTRQRFDGGNAAVDGEQAARILAVIRQSGLLDWYREAGEVNRDQLGWQP